MELATVALGAVLIGLFVYSNFALDRVWLPAAGATAASSARMRLARGIAEATLFFVGVALIAGGFSKIGINSGYGGF